MNLQNAVVVITGASRGLGKALAEAFSCRGATLVLGSRNLAELEAVAKTTCGIAVKTDVVVQSDVDVLAETAIKKFGRIDLWINNAGITLPHASFDQIDWTAGHNVMEVNFFGTVYGCVAASQHMREQKSGIIVNVLSRRALNVTTKGSAYYASKAAAINFTNNMREELKETSIHVIAVYPGGMQTPMHNRNGKKHKQYDSFMKPDFVAEQILQNLERERPEEEMIVWKNT